MINKLFGLLACHFGAHDWTSAVLEGRDPDPEQLAARAVGFADYAKQYCRRCNAISPLSLAMIARARTKK